MRQDTGDTGDTGMPELASALQRFRDMLAADGYTLSWVVSEQDKVVVRIEAGPEACADCLVPMPIMEGIMADALRPTRYELDHIVAPAKA